MAVSTSFSPGAKVEVDPVLTEGVGAAPQMTRGRPRIHPDRKAYKAQKQREYRARKAAEKEAGK